ncbi:hypothetical protein GCM10027562_34400 [Arthrobacter pigmenti]
MWLLQQAERSADALPELRINNRRQSCALAEHAARFPLPPVTVLTQNTIPNLDLTRPVLRIDNNYAARANEHMVNVRLRPPGPMRIVQGHPPE